MSTAALRLTNVSKSFARAAVIQDVSLTVMPGERHAVIGPNGAGKSTLFNLISGKDAPSSGKIELHGHDVAGMPPEKIALRGMARSFQTTNIFLRLTVWENVCGALLWPLGHRYSIRSCALRLKDVRERALQLLEDIGLLDRKDHLAGALSYPDQRTLEFGLTVVADASVILLDEPMAGMNHGETRRVLSLIERMSSGRTLLMIEHDMDVVFGFADRISVLVHGRIVATGTPTEIRENDAVQNAYLGASRK